MELWVISHMKRQWCIQLFIFLSIAHICNTQNNLPPINLIDNGYEGLVISVPSDIPEDSTIIDRIKEIMTNTSAIMHVATR